MEHGRPRPRCRPLGDSPLLTVEPGWSWTGRGAGGAGLARPCCRSAGRQIRQRPPRILSISRNAFERLVPPLNRSVKRSASATADIRRDPLMTEKCSAILSSEASGRGARVSDVNLLKPIGGRMQQACHHHSARRSLQVIFIRLQSRCGRPAVHPIHHAVRDRALLAGQFHSGQSRDVSARPSRLTGGAPASSLLLCTSTQPGELGTRPVGDVRSSFGFRSADDELSALHVGEDVAGAVDVDIE